MYEYRPFGDGQDARADEQAKKEQGSEQKASQNPYFSTMEYMRGGASYTPPPPAPKPIYRGKDTLFAYLAILFGFFFVRTLPISKSPLGTMLMILLLFLFGGAFLALSRVRLSPLSLTLGSCAALLSVGLFTGGNAVIRGVLFWVLLLLFCCFVYAACGLAGKSLFTDRIFSHVWNAIALPFRSCSHIFPALPVRLKKGSSDGRYLRGIGWALLGLCIASIPTAIVIALLSYDAQFTALLKDLFDFSLDGVWEYLRDIVLGFLVAIPLFGTTFGAAWRREQNGGVAEQISKANTRVLPRPLVIASVTPLLLVYVLFFVSQWSYYVSAFTHVLPNDLTYAAYAREGFFELCWVAAINALLLLLFNLLIRPCKNERFDALRAVYSAVISIFTLILIATALSKMILYIDSYGLTQKRVYASWLMLLFAAVFILVLIRQFVRKLPLAAAIAVCGICFFALIALPNVDGMIANYNVDAYLSKKLPTVDVESIADYGVSSVPALCRLEEDLKARKNPTADERTFLAYTSSALDALAIDLKGTDHTVWSFSFPTARARRLLEGREVWLESTDG